MKRILSCLLVVMSLLAAPVFALSKPAPQDDEVVRVESDVVVVNVTVTDSSGKFVSGLRASDFHLFEDGVEQKISSFQPEEAPFAAAILMDFSGSMEQSVTLARSAAIRFLDGLRDTDVAAVYKFDSEVTQLQDFAPGRDLAPMAFEQKAKGMTALNDAVLEAARELNKREEKRRAIVVLSDGMDTSSRASQNKALAAAIASDAMIYTVDLGDRTPSIGQMSAAGALKNFSLKSGGRYISTPGGVALRDAFASIVTELGNQYTLTFHTTNHSKDGKWRSLDVKVAQKGIEVRTRKGYYGSKG